MCLQLDNRVNIKFSNGQATLYKIVRVEGSCLLSPVMSCTVRPGRNQSTRQNTQLTTEEQTSGRVHEGIHCYLRKDAAARQLLDWERFGHYWLQKSDYTVVKVAAKKEHLVATGYDDDHEENAVFTESTLGKQHVPISQ